MLRIVYSGGIDPLTWCFALFPKPSVPEPLQWRFEFFSIVYLFPFFQLNRLCFPWVGWKLNSKKRRSLRREVVTNWHLGGGGVCLFAPLSWYFFRNIPSLWKAACGHQEVPGVKSGCFRLKPDIREERESWWYKWDFKSPTHDFSPLWC